MKPQKFAYHAPGTTAEAVELLGKLGPDAKVLAGGQSLIPLLNLRLAAPEHLIDVTGIAELRERRRQNGTLSIGAATRHCDLAAEPEIAGSCPLLPMAARYIGHPQIRTRGTMGGSLSHADPAAELPAVALALDAVMVLRSVRGERRVAAEDFFVSYLTTDLAEDELLVTIEYPVAGHREGSAFCEVAARGGDFAIAGVAAVIRLDGAGNVEHASIACMSVAGTPVRARSAEKLLLGQEPGDAAAAAVEAAVAGELDPSPHLKVSAGYKRRTSGILARRAVQQAWRLALGRTG